jgi:hypothetical protein
MIHLPEAMAGAASSFDTGMLGGAIIVRLGTETGATMVLKFEQRRRGLPTNLRRRLITSGVQATRLLPTRKC